MNLFNSDAIQFVLYFVVPGVVAVAIHDSMVASERRNWQEMSLVLVTYGVINLFIPVGMAFLSVRVGRSRFVKRLFRGIFLDPIRGSGSKRTGINGKYVKHLIERVKIFIS